MPFRVLLLLAAAAVVALVLAYSITRNRRYLSWAWWVGKLSLGMVLLFGLLYVLERLILI
jgi:hypothetical protein